ncbi:MAG: DUF1559 domain-containing protein [Pirellulaceae bacterium]
MKNRSLFHSALALLLCLSSGISVVRSEDSIVDRVPEDLSLVLSLDVERMLESDLVQALPVEVLEVLLQQNVGVELASIKRIVVGMQVPSQVNPPKMLVLVELATDINASELLPTIVGERQPIELGKGVKGFVLPFPGVNVSVAVDSKRVVIAGTDLAVKNASVAQADPENMTQSKLRALDPKYPVSIMANLSNVPVEYKQLAAATFGDEELPANIKLLIAKLMQLETVHLKIALDIDGIDGELDLDAADHKSAMALKEQMMSMLGELRAMLIAQMSTISSNDPLVDAALMKYVERISGQVVDSLKPTVDGAQLRFQGRGITSVAVSGTLVGLLLPAVSSARNAARRMSSQNNLKQIGLALFNYQDAFGELPTGESDRIKYKDGKPLLSWRVHILPFLEQDALYRQFKLDEPWDSPHNLPLSKMVVPIFTDPRHDLAPGMTTYQIPFGKDSLMGRHEKTQIRDALDGGARTIMTVNVGPEHAVPWTKPVDWKFDRVNPVASVGRATSNGSFQVGLADGSVVELSFRIAPTLLLNLLNRNDGR